MWATVFCHSEPPFLQEWGRTLGKRTFATMSSGACGETQMVVFRPSVCRFILLAHSLWLWELQLPVRMTGRNQEIKHMQISAKIMIPCKISKTRGSWYHSEHSVISECKRLFGLHSTHVRGLPVFLNYETWMCGLRSSSSQATVSNYMDQKI